MDVSEIDAFTVLAWMHLHDAAPVDWSVGGVLIGAALVGALVTLFSTSPSELPWLGGAEDLQERAQKLQDLEDIEEAVLRGQREPDNLSPQRAAHIRHLTRRVNAERRSLLLRGIPIFLVIGPVVATALATTLWQALLLGATGPAALRAIGLRHKAKSLVAENGPLIREYLQAESRDYADLARTERRLREQLGAAYEALELMRE